MVTCSATYRFSILQFKESDFTLRTPVSYNYHRMLLDGPLSDEDSVTYGINYRSPLNELDNFHVIDQVPQDIMHVLLEGVIPYELLLMLTSFVNDQKYFSVHLLNDRIASFAYSTHEGTNKPSPIKSTVFTHRSSLIGPNM